MALCEPKTLRGIHGMARKLGLDHEQLREMTSTGSLRLVKQAEAQRLFNWLREKVDKQQGGPPQRGPWRLYSSSTLCKEIEKYAREIRWQEPDGFRRWLLKCFKIESIRFVSSFKQATDIKNALKRMYHEQVETARRNEQINI